MGWKADEVNKLPDGRREEIKYSRDPELRSVFARIRKIKSRDGETLEVWHEVINGAGSILHQHQKSVRRKRNSA